MSSRVASQIETQEKYSGRVGFVPDPTLTVDPTTSMHDYAYDIGADSTIEYWIDHPIRCGYLSAFCERQFCGENISFIMEIDRFRDLMASDKDSWGKISWRQIDQSIGIHLGEKISDSKNHKNKYSSGPEDLVIGGESDWPSKTIARDAVVEHVYFIWNKFLSDSAPHQICVPARVLTNTKLRLEYLHVYGREVFQETLIDPLKTLKRDVLPRFLPSVFYEKLEARTEIIAGNFPPGSALSLPAPKDSKVLYIASEQITLNFLKEIDLSDLICDYILYDQFLKYLRAIVSSENLLCARAVEVYRNMWDEPTPLKRANVEVEDMAWIIYQFFVASGSAYEVSVSHKRRKQIMQGLASPSKQLFYRIESSVTAALKQHYENYFKSDEFAALPEKIASEKAKSRKKSCFGV